jgi:hypothetical protein
MLTLIASKFRLLKRSGTFINGEIVVIIRKMLPRYMATYNAPALLLFICTSPQHCEIAEDYYPTHIQISGR